MFSIFHNNYFMNHALLKARMAVTLTFQASMGICGLNK